MTNNGICINNMGLGGTIEEVVGTDENFAIKFSNGLMIVLQQQYYTITPDRSVVIAYCTFPCEMEYPVSFIKPPITQVTMYNNNFVSVNPYSEDKKKGSLLNKCCERFEAYRNEKDISDTITINVTAIGWWK